MSCGIYCIKNKTNNKLYVGSSRNLDRRKNDHFSALRNNRHYNKYLQRAWNKHGEENFEFQILEYCSESLLLTIEQCYLDTYRKDLYNLEVRAGKPPSQEGKTATKETREKLRKVWLGRKHKESTKKILSAQKKGKKFSEEHKKKLSEAKLKYYRNKRMENI